MNAYSLKKIGAMPVIRKTWIGEEVTANLLVAAHLFCTVADWYIVEHDGSGLYYGFVSIGGMEQNSEWGDFTLAELRYVRDPLGLCIEFDEFWEPCRAEEVGSIKCRW